MASLHEWGTAAKRSEPDEWVSLPVDATSLAIARRAVRDLVAGRVGTMVDDAVQVTDELVSNAYRHGQAPRTVRLGLIGGQLLRIEVDDASAMEPVLRSPDRTGGLGMLLVHRLSSSWGVQRHARHKTVWAELELDGPTGHGHARHLSSVAPEALPD